MSKNGQPGDGARFLRPRIIFEASIQPQNDRGYEYLISTTRYNFVDPVFRRILRDASYALPYFAAAKLVIVCFDRQVTDIEAQRGIISSDYEIGGLGELLAFGERFPEVQRRKPIAAISTAFCCGRGGPEVPYLSGDWSTRMLYSTLLSRLFPADWGFSAVASRLV